MLKVPFDKVRWIINKHIKDYNHGPEDFARWNTHQDTRRVAYLYGVTRRNRKKVDLWTDILKVNQLIDPSTKFD